MVCYALGPADGESWLTPAEVVGRLQTAFTWVEVDAQEGIRYASRVLTLMKQMSAPQAVIDHLERRYEDSLAITVSDSGPDAEDRLEFVVMSEESLKIHTKPRLLFLVTRCRVALGYDLLEL